MAELNAESAAVLARLVDFAQPFDVRLLDSVCVAAYNAPDEGQADTLLSKFQEHPQAWTKVDVMLEQSASPFTKYYALTVLEKAVRTRWKTLPKDQRELVKNYITQLVMRLCADAAQMAHHKVLIGKLNSTLVQIIAQEWPHNWPSFVGDILGASSSSETVCENNLVILRMLSEEIFDFSRGRMTSKKAAVLKLQFNAEFMAVFKMCESILNQSQNVQLLSTTVETMLRFLSWIPLGYIFETNLIPLLVQKFLMLDGTRTSSLKCLAEIASLQVDEAYRKAAVDMYTGVLQRVQVFLPVSTDFETAYENGNTMTQNFIQTLALFLSNFFRNYLTLLELPPLQQINKEGHEYLLAIARVTEIEVFKICAEYFFFLANGLYAERSTGMAVNAPLLLASSFATQTSLVSHRVVMYQQVMSRIRLLMIERMPRPEEVLIEESDGELVQVVMTDTNMLQLHQTMKETLIYLTHIDWNDTYALMLDKLSHQMDGSEWSWNNLNTLCWAVGSISGAMPVEQEKRFLVHVIRDLLTLTDMKHGKENKAVVASNIMYVVGQYPRFLSDHWAFLKTVVKKLFEFMHEMFAGVRDMACNTFVKIANKTRIKFVRVQLGETRPFIEELVYDLLRPTIAELEPHQVQTFYEAVGFMVQAQNDAPVRERLLLALLQDPSHKWTAILRSASQDMGALKQLNVCKEISQILKINSRVCGSVGGPYVSQLGRMFMDMMNLYKAYSTLTVQLIASGQPNALGTIVGKAFVGIKRDIIALISKFVSVAVDRHVIAQNIMGALVEALCADYANSPPEARESDVLGLLSAVVGCVQGLAAPVVPMILAGTFKQTLALITRDIESFPQHRVQFYELLRHIVKYCPEQVFQLSGEDFKLFLDALVWGGKHTAAEVSLVGLMATFDLVQTATRTPIAQPFFQSYFLLLLREVFAVLTDSFHKNAFKEQCALLQLMCQLVESGAVQVPLWGDASVASTNQIFVRKYLDDLLGSAFPNVAVQTRQAFVQGLLEQGATQAKFRTHVRDFLVELQEFSSGDNAALYEEEMQATLEQQQRMRATVPGLQGPPDPVNDDDDDDM